MDNIYKSIGKKLKQFRQEAGMTQEQLGGHAQITQNYLTLLESGKKKATVEVLVRIANALELPLSQLFESKPEVKTGIDYGKQVNMMLKDMTPKQRLLFMNLVKDSAKRIRTQPED